MQILNSYHVWKIRLKKSGEDVETKANKDKLWKNVELIFQISKTKPCYSCICFSMLASIIKQFLWNFQLENYS